jgi:tRNA(Arg) A34 adenosine deaminase TadA
MKKPASIQITLPEWISSWEEENEIYLPQRRRHEELMELALSLGIRHLNEGTGGPFASLIYEEQEGRILSIGVNLVLSHNNSCLHAETTAIMFAQREVSSYSLQKGSMNCTLIATAQPCAMCLGAIPWSGIRTLVYGSPKEEVETIVGFQEGDIPEHWKEKLEMRGISVKGPMLQEKARKLLEQYTHSNGVLY